MRVWDRPLHRPHLFCHTPRPPGQQSTWKELHGASAGMPPVSVSGTLRSRDGFRVLPRPSNNDHELTAQNVFVS